MRFLDISKRGEFSFSMDHYRTEKRSKKNKNFLKFWW